MNKLIIEYLNSKIDPDVSRLKTYINNVEESLNGRREYILMEIRNYKREKQEYFEANEELNNLYEIAKTLENE